MCGFVGFINMINDSNAVMKNMLNSIIHRGPDAEGTYFDEDIALGHRRLSIIDVSDSGNQPLFSEDKTKVLVFNGEIYNYMEIREELIKKGYKFRTKTDSEVLIHGYTEYGSKLMTKLRGMFAFVIWDKEKKELFGARDYFGIKPLYYYKKDNDFIFGSEIKSFLHHPAFVKELNVDALENYLTFQYSATDETFFKNVYKLPPAHYFTYKDGKLEINRYWQVEFKADHSHTLEETVNEISEVFHDSVKAHKIADVEVGSFLSSGVDSSYVAAVADVDKTFTVGFDNGEKYNEIDWAKGFSDAIGKKNYSKIISEYDYWNNLKRLQYHMDEPLADPAAIALYFVCNTAHNHNLKVCLSGEGADELFGGYNVYSEPGATAYDRLPRGIKRGIGKIASALPEHKGRNFFVRKGKDLEERFIGNAYMFTPAQRKDLLKVKTNAKDPMEITKPYYDKVKNQDDVTKMQYIDLHLWMAGDILLKADKMSMANSLEVRVPFLDIKVMELAQTIPTEYRVTRKEKTDENTPYITKYAMRLAAKKDTPSQTAKTAAKKKLGFPVPTRVWLKQDKYYNIVLEKFSSPAANEFFHTEKLKKLLDDHRAGKADNSRKIWTVYMFLLWYEVYFESDDIKKTIDEKIA
jgi:asparagine synthase (glutamine-hydrolysing)